MRISCLRNWINKSVLSDLLFSLRFRSIDIIPLPWLTEVLKMNDLQYLVEVFFLIKYFSFWLSEFAIGKNKIEKKSNAFLNRKIENIQTLHAVLTNYFERTFIQIRFIFLFQFVILLVHHESNLLFEFSCFILILYAVFSTYRLSGVITICQTICWTSKSPIIWGAIEQHSPFTYCFSEVLSFHALSCS